MTRGIGEFEPIQELIPEWAALAVALVTQLGDVWFLALVVGAVYWLNANRREDMAVTVGVTLAGFAVISALKHVFALPRPGRPLVEPEAFPWLLQSLYESTAMAGGYGFPSGHALMTTIVSVSLARRLSIGTARQRLAGAATVVGVVCLSRVALGVHYLVDVLAGVVVGLTFLLVADRLLARYPTEQGTVAFSLAVGLSALNVVASDVTSSAVLLLGASLGAFASWQLVRLGDDLVAIDRPLDAVQPIIWRGGCAVGAAAPLVVALEEFALRSLPATGGAVGLAVGMFIVLPVLNRSERAGHVWKRTVFWTTIAAFGVRCLLRPSTWRRGADSCREGAVRLRRWARSRRPPRPRARSER